MRITKNSHKPLKWKTSSMSVVMVTVGKYCTKLYCCCYCCFCFCFCDNCFCWGKNENCASVLLRVEHTEKGDAVSPVKTHTHTPWSTQRNQHRNFCTRTRKEKGRKESKTLRQPSAQLTARQSKKEEGQNGKGKESVRVTVEKRHLGQEKDSIVWHSEFSTVNQAKDIHQNVCFVLFCFMAFQ